MLSISHTHHQIHWSTYRRKTNPSFKVKSSLCLLAGSIKPPISPLATLQADLPGPKSIPQCGATQWEVTRKRGRDGMREHSKCTEWSSLVRWKWCLCIHIHTFLGHSCSPLFRESHLEYDKHQICSFDIRSWIVSTFVQPELNVTDAGGADEQWGFQSAVVAEGNTKVDTQLFWLSLLKSWLFDPGYVSCSCHITNISCLKQTFLLDTVTYR